MPLSAGCHASPQIQEIPRLFEETKIKDGTKRMQMKMPRCRSTKRNQRKSASESRALLPVGHLDENLGKSSNAIE
jgi:hypothetical protein